MRAMVLLGILVGAMTAHADGPRGWRGGPRADLFIDVPLEYDTGVTFPFGGAHHAVPGVVSINKAPYYCAPHAQSFRARAAFVEHLSVKHGLADEEIPSAVMVRDNQVRYVGD
ncbi:MAG: hypothetical protein IT293_21175 [Deltaproteobacteria bacterium]|nr:hypothetical protein [Deltaproteobacteria bacterium]